MQIIVMASSLLSSSTPALRVLLVEDHALTRRGLIDLLCMEYPDIYCQECQTFEEACKQLKKDWDLAIVDHQLPDGRGIDLLECMGTIPAMMLTMFDDVLLAHEARSRGAKGFVSKGDSPVAIGAAIRKVLAGVPSFAVLAESTSPRLSEREKSVLKGLLQGEGCKQISLRLELSHSSVQTYKARLFEKLGVENLSHLLRSATAKGLR